jgi:NCS1 family nucleobase:cation symporter-1
MTAITFIGILGWAMHKNGGPGPIISSNIHLSHHDRVFKFLQCTSATAATWGGSGDRLSDWTRFSKSRRASTPALLTGLMLSMVPTAVIGVLVTSAFFQMYGKPIWTPLGMLLYVQSVEYTPTVRAATFFAGVGLFCSQIYINIVQNAFAFGMDFAGIFPKYVSMRRGAVIVSLVAIACNPWRFLSQAAIFIQAFSVFAVFSSASTATLNMDYWLVRRRKWKVPDLFHPDGIYWYYHGVNPRAVAAFLIAITPSLRKYLTLCCRCHYVKADKSSAGFAFSMMGGVHLKSAAYNIYQMTFFVGYPLSGISYFIICKIFPPIGLGVQEELEGYDDEIAPHIIEGKSPDTQSATACEEKQTSAESVGEKKQ